MPIEDKDFKKTLGTVNEVELYLKNHPTLWFRPSELMELFDLTLPQVMTRLGYARKRDLVEHIRPRWRWKSD